MSLRTVLVALDLSPASRAALERAASLVADDGRLHLLHVIDTVIDGTAPRYATPSELDAYRGQREKEASAILEALAREVRGARPRLTVEVAVRFAHTTEELLATAQRIGADLVAVGAHGKNVLERLVIGSVAEEIARRSAVPTLVVREAPGAERSVERVLVALDLDDSSREAARFADRLARGLGRPLEALHALDTNRLPLQSAGVLDPALLDAETRDAIQGAPRAVADFLAASGVGPASVRVLAGAPAEEVVRAATASDVIVCGTHARGFLGRIAFGSVARAIVRGAPCPVIVVHPRAALAASEARDVNRRAASSASPSA